MRTCPPTAAGAWYSSDSIQLIFSGSQLGTVAAKAPPGPQHADDLGERAGVVGDVLEHLGRDHGVEAAVGERQPRGVAAQHADARPGGDLAGLDHRRERVARAAHLVVGEVERDHAMTAGGPARRRGDRSRRRRRAPGPPAARRARPTDRSGSSASAGGPGSDRTAVAMQLGDVGRHRQHLAVLLDGELGAAPPRPAVEHALASGGADAGAQLGVVEAAADRRGQRVGVAGRGTAAPCRRRVPVTSGSAPPSVATSAVPVTIASIAGRLNPSYRLGTTASSASAYSSTMRSSVTPDTNSTCARRPSGVDQVHALAGLRLADDRQRDVALGAQLGDRLEQVGQPLQGDVGRRGGDQPTGHAGDVRPRAEQLGVDADRDQPHAVVGRRPCRCGCRGSSSR